MMPIVKNNGRTVFGVRMGLGGKWSAAIHQRWSKRFDGGQRGAILPCLQSLLPEGGICSKERLVSRSTTEFRQFDVENLDIESAAPQRLGKCHSLAGLRLFFFSGPLLFDSLEAIESVCPTPPAGSDMAGGFSCDN